MQPDPRDSSDDASRVDQLHVEIHTAHPGTVIVAARGQVDVASAPVLSDALDRALDVSHSQLVVDLTEVTFLDATTLDLLVQARQRAAAVGATIRVKCGNGLGRLLFKTVGLEHLLD